MSWTCKVKYSKEEDYDLEDLFLEEPVTEDNLLDIVMDAVRFDLENRDGLFEVCRSMNPNRADFDIECERD